MRFISTISLLFSFSFSLSGKIVVKNLDIEKKELIYTFIQSDNNHYFLDSRLLLHNGDSITFVPNRGYMGYLLRNHVYLQKKLGDPQLFQELDIETRKLNYGFETWELKMFNFLSGSRIVSSNLIYSKQDSLSKLFLKVSFSGEVFYLKRLSGELDDTRGGFNNSKINKAFVFNSISSMEAINLCSDCMPFYDTIRYFRHE